MKNLLKKELSELLNKQMLLGLLVSFILIIMLGFVMTSTVSGTLETGEEIHIIDLDNTEFTQQIITRLEEKGYLVEFTTENKPYEIILEEQNWNEAVVLPEGITDNLLSENQTCELNSITALKTTSTMNFAFADSSSAEFVNNMIKILLSEQFLTDNLAFLENPIMITDYTVANGKSIQANSISLVSSMAIFDQLMPLLLFMLVILTSQTIITAIATEKTDKTLETLLSAPVPRSVIIGAKMLSAFIVALIYAIVYGLGFLTALLFTVDSTAENINISSAFSDMIHIQEATQTLGLQIPVLGWAGVIIQLLLTVGISLTASMMLGGLVEDAKGSQTASLPILIFTMFPYILSMISDIRNLELPVRILLYCIPFTHTFIATGCLRFHQTGLFLAGMVYQIIFLVAIAFCALKLYQSDILFVHSLSKKNKILKSQGGNS
ncbi:MAG: ABC transporter permease [Ruminococcus sp.]|nr:ABC transporter permease [Ruminococcus sp.]